MNERDNVMVTAKGRSILSVPNLIYSLPINEACQLPPLQSGKNYIDTSSTQSCKFAQPAPMEGVNSNNIFIFYLLSFLPSPFLPVHPHWQESRNTSTGPEGWWKMSKVQFIYDSSEHTYFKDAVNRECFGPKKALKVTAPHLPPALYLQGGKRGVISLVGG